MPHHRFIVPIIPLIILFTGKILDNQKWRKWIRLAFAVNIGLELILSITLFAPLSPSFGNFTNGLIDAGKWIRDTTAPDDIIAVVDAGALAYYSERKTIDILGLNDEHIAHSPEKSDPSYILGFNPVLIQLHVDFSNGEVILPEQHSNSLQLFDHPEFLRQYIPYWEGAKIPYFPSFFTRCNNCSDK